jgi:hypothetical protein
MKAEYLYTCVYSRVSATTMRWSTAISGHWLTAGIWQEAVSLECSTKRWVTKASALGIHSQMVVLRHKFGFVGLVMYLKQYILVFHVLAYVVKIFFWICIVWGKLDKFILRCIITQICGGLKKELDLKENYSGRLLCFPLNWTYRT